ncbi:hypothetical protein QQY66_06690 [Streptomyces sp. DG2A-72]|uniref:hypothetical protein n=1 Tax=Streptomyces sp. DG2A-72 TaxID=3051386 RepID=UPI00265C2D63|nr:hypothetical protein [Streptomyces sp. DG2A-72]MDO0931385.1 hypothetical protein [Streptomyces sp. DG2A-72]
MHRTSTTATLLVTVAVSALSGCVTVQLPPASGPSAPPSRAVPALPDDSAEPQIVQAPAREALERMGPPREPAPTASVRRPPPPAQTPEKAAPSRPRPPRPAPRTPEAPQRPRAEVTQTVPSDLGDVCDLGRQYGGWPQDSPQSRICEQTYGR